MLINSSELCVRSSSLGGNDVATCSMQNERALKPKGRDKWALIGRAVGTTNALQPFAVESRQRAMYARVHPRDREPGSLPSLDR